MMKKKNIFVFLFLACMVQAWEEGEERDLGEGIFLTGVTIGDGLYGDWMELFFVVENRSKIDFYQVIIEVTFETPNGEVVKKFIERIRHLKAGSKGLGGKLEFHRGVLFSETVENRKTISFKLFYAE